MSKVSFEESYAKAIAAVGRTKGGVPFGGYLKLTKAGEESAWWKHVLALHEAWIKIPLWGKKTSKIKGSSPEIRELISHLWWIPDHMIATTPHKAARVIAWASVLPGWKDGLLVFEAKAEKR